MPSQHSKIHSTNLTYFNYMGKYSNKLMLVVFLALISFIPSIFLPHIGEEGVYTISSFEMLYNRDFLNVVLYGGGYPRPPLYNWCIIGLNYLCNDVLVAARIVSILSTLGMCIIVGWLAKRLWQQRFIGILTTSVFLSGDLLLRRGWLAYSDPIFSFFVFTSMALLWLAVHESCLLWLVLSVIGIIGGSLAKVHTSYVFYGLTWLVLFWRYSEKRRFLLSIKAFLIYVIALTAPWVWTTYITNSGTIFSTMDVIEHLLQLGPIIKYIGKVSFYPLEIIIRTLPISMIVLSYVFLQQGKLTLNNAFFNKTIAVNNIFLTAGAIFLLNFIPYWLSPCSYMRYLMPLYPFLAMLFAYVIYQGGELLLQRSIKWLALCVLVNFILMFIWYPYDQTVRKGNAKAIATEIIAIVKEQPLYMNNSGSGGLRIAAELNKMRINKSPLRYITGEYTGYVVVNQPTDAMGNLIATYKLGGITVYLKCNGQHCKGRKECQASKANKENEQREVNKACTVNKEREARA